MQEGIQISTYFYKQYLREGCENKFKIKSLLEKHLCKKCEYEFKEHLIKKLHQCILHNDTIQMKSHWVISFKKSGP